jgi:hypothetical protein
MSLRTVLLAAPLLVSLTGCTLISTSIEGSSDLIAGSSRAIVGSFDAISASSGSSSPAAEPTPNRTSYRRDLRQYAAGFVRSEGTTDEFVRGVTRIAEDHGITHWESEPFTPRAIGEGLRDAHLSEAEMDAFIDGIGRDRPEAQLALDGYRQPGG